ncbi:VOC family protein [Solilutibacter silvestris]|uniref:VOC family protein n=1 Tax=Solilutibacter silvestris TaxID=1645665 RepID=UPI000CA05C7D|nr:VOC family protein [Lysobacter silvestris]
MADLGLTHIALPVRSLEASIAFYRLYASMDVVHRRTGTVWLCDHTRPFVIVLIETPLNTPIYPLVPTAHLGVAVESEHEVDRLCAIALDNRCLLRSAEQSGPPVGYWALISDPDGHTLEIAFGQYVGLTVAGVA